MPHAAVAPARQPAPEPISPQKPRNHSDRELLERYVVHHEQKAFTALVQRNGGSVWAVCRRVLQHTQDVEDAFQAVFFLLAKKAGSIRKREAVGSWLYGVAYRTAMRAKRSAARRRQVEASAATPSSGASPPTEAACRELQRLLDEEVQRLPDKYRAPFVLCCLQGLSKAEAAVELGWKEGTVSGRMTRARQFLHKRLTARGISLTAVLTSLRLTWQPSAAASSTMVPGTVHAVLSSVAGHSAAALSPGAVALAQGVLRALVLAKVKLGAAFLLALTIVAAGAEFIVQSPAAPLAQTNVTVNPAGAPEVRQPLPVKPLAIDEQILALTFSRDGKKLFTAGARPQLPGQLIIWDVATGKELARQRGIRGVRAVALAPDGEVLACGDLSGFVTFRDTTTGKELRRIKAHNVGVNGVAYSPDGTVLVTAGLDRLVKLWVNGRVPAKVFRGHTDMVFSVAFFRHGRAFVTTAKDKTARIWDVQSGSERFILRHPDGVEMAAISPDDRIVATASWDGKIRLWDAGTGTQIATLGTQKNALFALAFSPDGKLLASATGNGIVRIWDVQQRKPVASPHSHRQSVWALAFSLDGKLLASGSSDKTAKLWNIGALASWQPAATPLLFSAAATVGNGASPTGPMPLSVMASVANRPGLGSTKEVMQPVMVLNASEAVLPEAMPARPARKTVQGNHADWPGWRGPGSQGSQDKPTPVMDWTEMSGVLWKVPVPGQGHASPVVVGDRIFLSTADEEVRSMLCYDRQTGNLLWKTVIHRGGFMPKHQKNSYASPTPVCDGQQLYLPYAAGHALYLACLDLNGQLRWQSRLGPYASQWGYGSSPTFCKELVFVAADNGGRDTDGTTEPNSYLAAVDRRSGKIVWRVPRLNVDSYGTPVVAHVAGRDQLLLSGAEQISAYEPTTGEQLWFCRWSAQRSASSPAWSDNCVYASVTWPRQETVCVRADGKGDVTESNLVWRQARGATDVASPLYHDGRLYLVNERGMATCLDGATGKPLWQQRLGSCLTASPVRAGNALLAIDEEGSGYWLKTGPSFELLARNFVRDPVLASPALCGDQIILRSQSALWSLDGKSNPAPSPGNQEHITQQPLPPVLATPAGTSLPHLPASRASQDFRGKAGVDAWLVPGLGMLGVAILAVGGWFMAKPRQGARKKVAPASRIAPFAAHSESAAQTGSRCCLWSCSLCGRKLRAPGQFAGKKVKCPGCGGVVQAPGVAVPRQ